MSLDDSTGQSFDDVDRTGDVQFHTTVKLDMDAIASSQSTDQYQKDRQFVLAVIEEIRDTTESFALQFSEVDDFLGAFYGLTVLQKCYPEFQSSEINHLSNGLEDRLFQLFIEDESLLQKSTGIISESFRERLDEYKSLQASQPVSSEEAPLMSDRHLSEKEYRVVQSVLDSYAMEHPEEFAEIMAGKDMSVEEAESLFQDFGLDAHQYGDEAELDDEDGLEN